jgi:hypothetical protein
MNSTNAIKNIESIEEFTLFALDRSMEGLQQLAEEGRRCATALKARSPDSFSLLSALAVNLRDFNVFENDIISLYEIDRSTLNDGQGSLLTTEEHFQEILNRLATYLDQNDMDLLAHLLDSELPEVLNRFQALLPMLRDYVDVQYIQTTP